jgi:ABC-type hemin transport system ATPase subunit
MVARCTQFILARGQIIQAERRFRSQLFSAEKFDVIKLSRLVNQVATVSRLPVDLDPPLCALDAHHACLGLNLAHNVGVLAVCIRLRLYFPLSHL